MTQATELRELASLIHVDGSNSYVGVSSTAFTPTDAFIVKDDGARITVESATQEVAMLGRRGSSGVALQSGYLRLRNQGVTANGIVLDSDNVSWINGGNLGIGTNSPDALLHISDTSPHIDFGPHGGNRGKIGYHNLDVIIGSTSGTGSIIFKNNISSTDSPQNSGDVKMTIADVGLTIHSDTYNILNIQTDSNNDQTSTDGILKITNNDGSTDVTKAEFRWDESEDLVHVSYGDHGRHISINSSGNVGIGTHSESPVHTLDVDGAIGARQVRHSIRPTLNLDFANTKELDSRITFYRNSIATYYGSDGILKYASHNTPRFDHDPTTGECRGLLIEEDRSNILIYSNPIADLEFGSGWVNNAANKIQITINAGEAPDGTYSATRISSLINSQTDPDVYMYQSHNLNGGETITYSIWIKAPNAANVGKHVEFRGKRIGGSGSGWGTVGILTADWQRISVSNTYNADNNQTGRAYFGARTNYGYFTDPSGASVQFDAASEVLVWGAVAEEGDFVTSYIPTNLTSVSRSTSATYQDKDGVLRTADKDQPRFGYKWDGGKYVPTGLIVEPAVTNLSAETESFGANWYTTAYTKGSEFTHLPNGQRRSAVKLIMNSGQTANSPTALGVYLGVLPRVQNQIYNTSFFAKIPAANVENGVRIRDGLRTGAFLDINLNNGEVTNGSTSTFMDVIVEKYAHGWWRISYNYLYTGATGSGSWHAIRSYNDGNGTKGWLIWGSQVTTNPYNQYFGLSSYVPNPTGTYSLVTKTADVPDGAVATRYSDYAYIDIEKYNFWNDRESTIYAETETYIEDYTLGNYNASQYAFSPDTGRVQIRYDNTDGIHAIGYSTPAGVFTNIFTLTPPTATFVTSSKTALSIKQDDYDFSVNGSTISGTASDTSGAFPAPTKLFLGAYRQIASPSNSEHLNGVIKKISYYDKKLTNAEMQALTENN